MAVAKVIGKADEFELVFIHNKATDLWEAVVPKTDNGVYIVDLWAVDEVGNESHYAKALFTVDTTNIHCKLRLQILSCRLPNNKPYGMKLRRCSCVT